MGLRLRGGGVLDPRRALPARREDGGVPRHADESGDVQGRGGAAEDVLRLQQRGNQQGFWKCESIQVDFLIGD